MMITATAATAAAAVASAAATVASAASATASAAAAATASGLDRKLMKTLQTASRLLKKQLKAAQEGSSRQETAQNGSKWLQIGSGSGDLFEDEGLLSGLGRKLVSLKPDQNSADGQKQLNGSE